MNRLDRRAALAAGALIASTLTVGVPAVLAAPKIRYAGSSTIGEHVILPAAGAFAAKTGIALVAPEFQGSGRGLTMVLQGRAALGGVSRGLTAFEKQQPISHRIIGYDAIGIVVHADNPVRSLRKAELKGIYAGAITNWKHVGGPDAGIVLITQGLGSGRGQLVEMRDHLLDGAAHRTDRLEVDAPHDRLAALAGERHGITNTSLAFSRAGTRPVVIEGYPPEPRHVRSGAYLLSRPLVLVAPATPSPEVQQFLSFMLGREGQAIVARKFVPLR